MHRFFARFRKADCVAGPAAAELKRKRKKEKARTTVQVLMGRHGRWHDDCNCKAAGLLLLGWKWYVHLTIWQRQNGRTRPSSGISGCRLPLPFAHIQCWPTLSWWPVAEWRGEGSSLTHSFTVMAFIWLCSFFFTSSSFPLSPPLPPFPFIPLALYLTDHFL